MTLLSRIALTLLAGFLFGVDVVGQKPELYLQTGHTKSIVSLAVSPDGNTLASSQSEGVIKLWDVASGLEFRTISDPNPVTLTNKLQFSPDGTILASCGYHLTFWNPVSGEKLFTFEKTYNFAFSPDGKLIALVGDREISVWDLPPRTKLKSWPDPSLTRTSVAFSPDSKSLAASYDEGDKYWITIWELSANGEPKRIPTPAFDVTHLSFGRDGKAVFGEGNEDGKIKLWDVTTGLEVRTFEKDHHVSFSVSQAENIVAVGNSNAVELRSISTGQLIRTLGADVLADLDKVMTFTPDGKILVVGANSMHTRSLTSWDVASGRQVRAFNGHSRRGRISGSHDGNMLATGGEDGEIRLWDVAGGADMKVIARSLGLIQDLIFTPDDHAILYHNFKTIGLIDVRTTKILRTFADPVDPEASSLVSFTLSDDGRMMATGHTDGSVRIWDFETGKVVRRLVGHTYWSTNLVFSAGARFLSSYGRNGAGKEPTTILWDLQSGVALATIYRPELPYGAFSPDGKLFVTVQESNYLQIWNVGTGNNSRTIERTGRIKLASFRKNSNQLVVATDDSVEIWDISTGTMMESNKHPDPRHYIDPSPDRRFFYGGGQNGEIILWDATNSKMLATLVAIDDNDWVVTTPDGRFDGSPDGVKKVVYVQGRTILPLESFFEQFYTPRLLAQVISTETKLATTVSVDFSKALKLPPLVTVTSPKPGVSFKTDAVRIDVSALDQGGGVDEIRLYQNGKLVSDDTRLLVQGGAGASGTNKTFNVTLVPGINTFRATAFNKDRTEANPVEIQIELKAAVAESDLYILAIGLNDYKNPRYSLNYGRADAQAFADAAEARGRGIFKRIVKQIILDGQATREGIEEAFAKIIAQAKPQDAFVFYFAGHGVMSEGSDQTAAEFYLVPYDVVQLYGNDGALATNGVAAKLLKDLCTRVRAQKQLIVLDACQSAGVLETFATRGAAEEKAILQLARSAGVVVLAATGQDQVATEFGKLGHGVFTYALLQAMNGDADGGNPPDGKITATEIVAFINDRVPELTKQFRGKTQYPNAWARGQDFPLGIK